MNQNQFNFELFSLLATFMASFSTLFLFFSWLCSLHTEDARSVINVIFVLNKEEIDVHVYAHFSVGIVATAK